MGVAGGLQRCLSKYSILPLLEGHAPQAFTMLFCVCVCVCVCVFLLRQILSPEKRALLSGKKRAHKLKKNPWDSLWNVPPGFELNDITMHCKTVTD